MNSEQLQELLARIDEQLAGHVERYDRDRAETKERYIEERQERDKWRTGVETKIDRLDEKFTPVLRDHQMIVLAGKWIAALVATSWAVFKSWVFLKELK